MGNNSINDAFKELEYSTENGLPGSGALIRNGKPLHSPRRTVWTPFLPKLLS